MIKNLPNTTILQVYSPTVSTRYAQQVSDAGALVLFLLLALAWLVLPEFMVKYALLAGILSLLTYNAILLIRSRSHLLLPDLLPGIAILMLWIAPAVQYWMQEANGRFDGILMQVDATTYFRVALPGIIALGIGCSIPFPVKNMARYSIQHTIRWLNKRRWVLQMITGLGIVCLFTCSYVPGSLRFVCWIGRSFLIVPGIYYLLDPKSKYRYWYLLLLFVLMFLDALRTTMFGDMLAWVLTLGLYHVAFHHWRFIHLLAIQVSAFICLFILLAFKYEFRDQSAHVSDFSGKMALFGDMAHTQMHAVCNLDTWEDIIARLNQGANMSLALAYVPEHQPFVHGETIVTALKAACVPRLLWPDKPQAGGVDNAFRFMHSQLPYSINLGIVGEAYVNYGTGAVFFIFLVFYALIIKGLYWLLLYSSSKFPLLLFLLPVVLLPAIFVEMDMLIVSNHIVKGAVVCLGLVWALEYLPTERRSIMV